MILCGGRGGREDGLVGLDILRKRGMDREGGDRNGDQSFVFL